MAERVRITVGSGRVEVIAEARDDHHQLTAAPRPPPNPGPAGSSPPELVVRGDSDSFTVRVPTGTDVVVGSDSGDIELAGSFGAVSITTSSADVRVEEVASVDARSHSGRIDVDLSHGAVRAGSQSATIRIGRADGDVRVASDSGRIEIDDARGRGGGQDGQRRDRRDGHRYRPAPARDRVRDRSMSRCRTASSRTCSHRSASGKRPGRRRDAATTSRSPRARSAVTSRSRVG